MNYDDENISANLPFEYKLNFIFARPPALSILNCHAYEVGGGRTRMERFTSFPQDREFALLNLFGPLPWIQVNGKTMRLLCSSTHSQSTSQRMSSDQRLVPEKLPRKVKEKRNRPDRALDPDQRGNEVDSEKPQDEPTNNTISPLCSWLN